MFDQRSKLVFSQKVRFYISFVFYVIMSSTLLITCFLDRQAGANSVVPYQTPTTSGAAEGLP